MTSPMAADSPANCESRVCSPEESLTHWICRVRPSFCTARNFRRVQQAGAIAAIRVDEAERSMIESQQRLEQIHLDQLQAQYELQKQQTAYEMPGPSYNPVARILYFSG